MNRISAVERRRLLLEAALRVLSRDGLSALSIRAVVREAGMSLASFHYAYESREELLAEVIGSVVDGERAAGLAGFAAGSASLDDAVRQGLDGYVALLAEDPGREQAMFELTQHALRTPALAHLARQQYAHYHHLAAGLLEHLAERFDVVWDRPVPDLARLLVALTDGLSLAWLADRDDGATQQLVDTAARSLLAHAHAHVRVSP